MPISIITKEIIKTWQKKRNIQDMALVRLPMANILVSWLMAFAKAMACLSSPIMTFMMVIGKLARCMVRDFINSTTLSRTNTQASMRETSIMECVRERVK